ncbi:MAG: hypothetical protein Q8L36_03470 [bacterium]|nr:hypothetical protein [bacterium]
MEIPLPPVSGSAVTADINKDGECDFIFQDGTNIMIAFSDGDGKFVMATIIIGYDEQADNLEIIAMSGDDITSFPVDDQNRAVVELANNVARPYEL